MKHDKKFIENIDRLLDSTSLEDVKLGILLYCNASSPWQIKKKFDNRGHNLSESIPFDNFYPEHSFSKEWAVVILHHKTVIRPSMENDANYKSTDKNLEFF